MSLRNVGPRGPYRNLPLLTFNPIKRARLAAGLTQAQLAAELEVARTTVVAWEKDGVNVQMIYLPPCKRSKLNALLKGQTARRGDYSSDDPTKSQTARRGDYSSIDEKSPAPAPAPATIHKKRKGRTAKRGRRLAG